MIDLELIDVSRLQFAVTAMYHFLFVPLTLGLSWVLVIMESVYVMTAREIYRDMTRFWGLLFGINFVMAVTTGITLEFQFGTNWAYYSHYVGDVFGVPLAVEGMMAFILESTFVGLFFFGGDRLSKVQHLMVTFLVALGSNLSALWILVANGWMLAAETRSGAALLEFPPDGGIGCAVPVNFSASFFYLAIRNLARQRRLLRLAVWSIPLPWVASEPGWIVAEYGRKPWTISGVLPTLLSVSSLSASHVYASLAAFIAFHTALLMIEMYLTVKYIRLGPGSLGTGRYFGESAPGSTPATGEGPYRPREEGAR